MVPLVSVVSYVSADTVPFPYTDNDYTSAATTDVGHVLKNANQWGSVLENFLTLFDINYADPNHRGKAIVFIQVVINYILALLGSVAIVVIVYSFFMMFFSKADEWFAKARKTVIWAAIALLVIWASAYIVNYLFYIYNRGI